MQSRSTLALLAAVILIGCFIRFYERRTETTGKHKEEALRALRIDPDKITLLRIISDDLQVACEKKNGQWVITSPVATRADAGAIGNLLDQLEHLNRGEVITGREQKKNNLTLDNYGLERPRLKIVIADDRQQRTIRVGRNAPLGGQLYIMEEGRRDIIVTETNLLTALPHSAVDLRDRRLFQGLPGEVSRIDIRRKEGYLQLARAETGSWKIQKPMVGRAAQSAVQELLDSIFEVKIADFVADSFAAAALYGLDEPSAQVTMISDKKMGEQTLLMGKPVDRAPDQVYATLQGSDAVYAIGKDILDKLNVKAEDLRDRRLLTLPAYDIGFVRIEEGERAINLKKQDSGTWEVIEPKQYAADDRRVQNLLSDWTGARIEIFSDLPATNLAALGLAPPARKIIFSRKPLPVPPPAGSPEPAKATTAPPSEDEESFLVSSLSPAPGRLTVKPSREDSLFEISTDVMGSISLTPLYYRDHQVLAIDPDSVRRLTIQMDGTEQTVERDETNQFHATAASIEVNPEAPVEIANLLSNVSAIDFIAEDPKDMTPYGLQPPLATLTVGLSGEAGISKSIVIGNDAGPGAVFAMIKGADMVFTMGKGVRDKLLQPLYKVPPKAEEKTVEPGINKPAEQE